MLGKIRRIKDVVVKRWLQSYTRKRFHSSKERQIIYKEINKPE